MDRGAWRATVHGVTKSSTQLTMRGDTDQTLISSSSKLSSSCISTSLFFQVETQTKRTDFACSRGRGEWDQLKQQH